MEGTGPFRISVWRRELRWHPVSPGHFQRSWSTKHGLISPASPLIRCNLQVKPTMAFRRSNFSTSTRMGSEILATAGIAQSGTTPGNLAENTFGLPRYCQWVHPQSRIQIRCGHHAGAEHDDEPLRASCYKFRGLLNFANDACCFFERVASIRRQALT